MWFRYDIKSNPFLFSRVLDDVSYKGFSMVIMICVCTDVLVISEVMEVRIQIIWSHVRFF